MSEGSKEEQGEHAGGFLRPREGSRDPGLLRGHGE